MFLRDSCFKKQTIGALTWCIKTNNDITDLVLTALLIYLWIKNVFQNLTIMRNKTIA